MSVYLCLVVMVFALALCRQSRAGLDRVTWSVRVSAGVIALVFLLGAVGWAQDAPVNLRDVPPILKIGAQAPAFNLPGIDGKLHSLKEYDASKVLAIVCTCNDCPVAQMYEKRIKTLVSDYRDRGVALVAIMPNDPMSDRL